MRLIRELMKSLRPESLLYFVAMKHELKEQERNKK